MRDISIQSDGTVPTTTIAVDGKPVDNVTRVDWSISCEDGASRATLYLDIVPAQLKARSVLFVPCSGTRLRERVRLAWTVLRGER